MTLRQQILKKFYPMWMWATRAMSKRISAVKNNAAWQPVASFYDLSVTLNDGRRLHFSSLKGKKVLIVNTASDCGFTNQYEALQQLQERFSNQLVIIGFPANDFKEQEKGSDEEIATFCKLNYGVTFPLARKSSVIGNGKNEVYQWLSDKTKNGWNDKAPTWNFSKYLVSEEGVLLNYFDPGVSPTSKEVIAVIEKRNQQ
jgi:glutathione peroxidase